MIYSDAVITKKGTELLARLQALGTQMSLSYIALGAGTDRLTDESVKLSDQRQTFIFDSVQQSGDKVTLQAAPNNVGLAEGYTIREMGIYATDPDGGSVLYAVINTESDAQDYDTMPSYASDGDYKEIIFTISILVANAASVKIEVSSEALRRQVETLSADLEELKTRVNESAPVLIQEEAPSDTTALWVW
jgi:hypothetical protein